MGIAINNVVKSRVITDPDELAKLLGLDDVGNMMINVGYPFSEEQRNADHPGTQLAVALMAVKMQKLDAFNIEDFICRLTCRDACNDAPVDMPNGVSSLKPTYDRLKKWTAAGWELEVGISGLNEQDFYEMELFKIQQEVVREISEAFASAKQAAAETLGFPQKKES